MLPCPTCSPFMLMHKHDDPVLPLFSWARAVRAHGGGAGGFICTFMCNVLCLPLCYSFCFALHRFSQPVAGCTTCVAAPATFTCFRLHEESTTCGHSVRHVCQSEDIDIDIVPVRVGTIRLGSITGWDQANY